MTEKSQEWIRANQGHSSNEKLQDQFLLKEVFHPNQIPIAVHGTYYKHLKSILRSGLKRQGRQHIHFTTNHNSQKTVSGMRDSCEVLIYLDTAKALKAGIRFYRSANDVILTTGLSGTITSNFFQKVVDRNTKKQISTERSMIAKPSVSH